MTKEPTEPEIDPESELDKMVNGILEKYRGSERVRRRYELAKGAMEAMLGNNRIFTSGKDVDSDGCFVDSISTLSVELADALLEELERNPQ